MTDDELKARIYALPTRDELERMLDRFVTREVFTLENKNLRDEIKVVRDEIKELKSYPEAKMGRMIGFASLVALVVSTLINVLSHLAWR